MSDLEIYFNNNPGRLIHKYIHYFDIYERYFSKYRGKEVVIVEIGVYHGGSLQMWKNYFGDKARIIGIDINPECKKFEEQNIEIYIGSQSDRKFFSELKSKIPPIDILIDDGGHTMMQQIIAFEEMYSYVKNDGIYLCEDLHTSYWLRYGGGYKRRGTFIECSKKFIDKLNARYSEQGSLKPDYLTRSIRGLHYYTSMLVIEKGEVKDFNHEKTGISSLSKDFENSRLPKFLVMPVMGILHITNSILRFFRLPGIIWK